ncbi:hypothetical protein [Paenibacillus xerothermodurans]|uniref:Uncharacterized protein n=1 Tax=Paenibacillus xerothermodurans TaxID=1977292 RepID=A0A2W1NZW3_PAEXE|nr:hypothetical protein [Paenibacillus xerothermodurans]PZE20418.1 hypothetical protein CBW46_013370 [Paenibacillus xerothermodurans]
MAETYRKSRVEHYLERLEVRRQALKGQLEMSELEPSREFIRGQLSATDLIICEIAAEFGFDKAKEEGGESNGGKSHPK